MFCRNCGKKIPNNAKFCNHCGTLQNSHNNNENRVLRKLKKIGKVILIIILCLAAVIALWLGITIYKAIRQANTPTTASTTTVTTTGESPEETESEYIDTPMYDERQLYAANASGLSISLSDSAYAS